MASSVWKWIVHRVFSQPRVLTRSDFSVQEECFELEDIEALHVMVTVHQVGPATVRLCPEEEARLLVERALALGMPLRITTATEERS